MSISVWKRPYLTLGATALVWVSSLAAARAQTGFATDRFEPAGGGSDWFSLESLDFRGHLRPAGSIVGELAWKPLVIYDAGGHEVAPLVSRQATLHADAALVLWSRLRVDVNAPFVVWHDGTAGMVDGMAFAPPTSEPLGDLRLGADVRLFGRPEDGISVAAGAQVFVPTGHASAYTSDGVARFWPRLLAAGAAGPFEWAARIGYHVRPADKCGCAIPPGDEVTGGAALGVRVAAPVLLGAEAYASTSTTSGHFAKGTASPAEALLGVHVAVARDWTLGLGAGPGTEGAG
ncbi:MAG TPA: hypothetical protein VHL80_20620, partial [Polyangia bacterium]|nr:hypothetical protein [Polyangia bacterium]